MAGLRHLVETIGLQPEHFNTLIGLAILVGGVWALVRLYQDLTRPLVDQDKEQPNEKKG